MSEERKNRIHDILTHKGALGVNALAKELNEPLSTIQGYLERQGYFRKTADRKWDLPERIAAGISHESLIVLAKGSQSSIDIIRTQLAELNSTIETVSNSLVTLERGITNYAPMQLPVAESPELPKLVADILNDYVETEKAIKLHLKHVPEEYKELFKNYDSLTHMVMEGKKAFTKLIISITPVLSGQTDEVSTEVLELLETYQK